MDRICGPAEERVYRDLALLFATSSIAALFPGEDIPAPRVDRFPPLKAEEPFHVFVVGAEAFTVSGRVTGYLARSAYQVVVVLLAVGADEQEATERIDRYLDVAVQLALCDETLGGAVDEIPIPVVQERACGLDADGRFRAGAKIAYTCATHIAADSDARAIIESGGAS